MIFLFGISISFFLLLLLILKKDKIQADKVLLIWLAVVAIHQALFYIDYSGLIASYGWLVGLEIPFPLLHGPLLFLYTSSLIKGSNRKKRLPSWVHFIPFILITIYLIPFFLKPTEHKLFVFENDGAGQEIFVIINFVLIIASGVGYIIGTLFLINSHQKNIREQFSNTDKVNLKWLQYLTYGLSGIWIIVFLGNPVWTFLSVALFVLTIGLFGIRQGKIFALEATSSAAPDQEATQPNQNQKRYLNSGLSDKRKKLIENKMTHLMEIEKAYLNPDLSLTLLANQLESQPNSISQYINEELGVSFYDFINSLRVEEFKRLIVIPKYQNYKLIEVAYDCGFNSKSSFNRSFKKIEGRTPSQYVSDIVRTTNYST